MTSVLLTAIVVLLLFGAVAVLVVGAGLFLWREFKIQNDALRLDLSASLAAHEAGVEKQLAKIGKLIENTRGPANNDWNSRSELRAIHSALSQGDIHAGLHLAEVGQLPPVERLRAIDERLIFLDEAITGNE